MRILLVLAVFLSTCCSAQISVHPTLGLKPWFDAWYAASTKSAKKMKIKGRIEKEVINLYLTIVNGTPTDSEGVEGVAGARFPSRTYRATQPTLTFSVIPAFPAESPENGFFSTSEWESLFEKYMYNDSVPKKTWDVFALKPEAYRVPGLVLTQEKSIEIQGFLDQDIRADSLQTGIYPERPVRGERWEQLKEWINLIEPHWRNRWIFRSFPVVQGILIDKKRTGAVVQYRTHNGGGVAVYRKEGARWQQVNSRITTLQ